ncbi:hypothetical protein PSPO01_11700 [Paraphaeosphaeria sporulosa]
MEYAFSPETWAVIKFGYEALSYVWGTAQNPSRAYVSCSNASSQGVISIGQNLDVALRHLRYETEPRRLWIDALCIDQTNLNERSSQVSIMDKVYSIATRTVAWLGPNRNSDETITLLQGLSQIVEFEFPFRQIRPIAEDPAGWADSSVPMPWHEDQLRDILTFIARPYFGRVWIQQELLLARDIEFQCGFVKIAERVLWNGLGCVRSKGVSHPNVTYTNTFNQEWNLVWPRIVDLIQNRLARLRTAQTPVDHIPLSNIRLISRELGCQDPRDRIYAFLGLLPDQDRAGLFTKRGRHIH